MAPTSISGVFVGYNHNRKAYRIYHPESKRIFASCQVKFDESVFQLENTKATVSSHSFATSTIGGTPSYPSGYNPSDSENDVSDSGSCNFETRDLVLADPVLDPVTQQLQTTYTQLHVTNSQYLNLHQMNFEVTAPNFRVRAHAQHLSQLAPNPTGCHKCDHVSTDLLPLLIPNKYIGTSRSVKQSCTHVAGTIKTFRLPTTLGCL